MRLRNPSGTGPASDSGVANMDDQRDIVQELMSRIDTLPADKQAIVMELGSRFNVGPKPPKPKLPFAAFSAACASGLSEEYGRVSGSRAGRGEGGEGWGEGGGR